MTRPSASIDERPLCALAIAAALAIAGCRGGGERPSRASREHAGLASEAARWHDERLRKLTAEDGWLTLVGLCWLEEGPNGVGSRAAHRVRYDRLPEDVGVITLAGGVVTFASSPGVDVEGLPAGGRLVTDSGQDASVLALGAIRMHIIERGGRFGVRIRDADSQVRLGFRGIDRFPVDPAWRIEATFRPAAPSTWVSVASVIGTVSDQAIAGRASFEVDGLRFDVVLMPGAGPDVFFVVFGDETNGMTTHPGGRFLDAKLAGDGRAVILDFNRAYNPPCAFTDFATCPLPGPDNLLPLRVEAGERSPSSTGRGP